MTTRIRIWDLPTRLFHWFLALAVVALVVTAKTGAMDWHFRLGYLVGALLIFRILWGFFGGYWSRFASFLHAPSTVVSYLKGDSDGHHGHNPLGALSVVGLLLVLVAQVATGLTSDDEISLTGPLAKYASGAVVSAASFYHRNYGQWLIYGLVGLHVLAICIYLLKKQNLVTPMITGDKDLPESTRASQDSWLTRAIALFALAAGIAVMGWIYSLGL